MRKLMYFALVAFLGGLTALFMQNLLFKPEVPVRSTSGSFERSITPAALTHFLSDNPNTLPDFTLVAEMTVNTVVHIRAEFENQTNLYDQYFGPHQDMFRDFFFGPRQRRPQQPRVIEGSGSGVIISPDGYIVTNNHVVADARLVEVTLNDNRIFEAVIVGTDPTTDLALLKIQSEDLPYAVFGDSDEVMVGEWVLAVGNPFNLTSTVTAGIVSAKGRRINILGGDTAIESFIQTDAAVNRGNSGGALVNTRGELIGINAAIASTTGSFAGYSFAIPANIAFKVVTDLKEHGEVQRGFLGVAINDLNPRFIRDNELDISLNSGVFVGGVNEGGAGEALGLKEGDVITSIDGRKVHTASDLIELVGRKRPGDEINVTYYRNGRTIEGKAVLKNIHGDTSIVQRADKETIEHLGARLENMNAQELRRFGVEHGVRVSSISRGALANSGIREGFVITHVDRKPIKNARELINTLSGKSGGVLIEGVYPNGVRAYYGVGL